MKKRIYIAHSSNFNYKEELYKPLRKSKLNETYEIILPHEFSDEPYSSKEFFKDSCDLIVSECSWHSTGAGIELGWANAFAVPIIAIYRKGNKLPGSVKTVTTYFVEYSDSKQLISELKKLIGDLLNIS